MLSLESLCIRATNTVWTLYVDAVCLNDDGNLFDASMLAIVAALRNSEYLTVHVGNK